MKTTKQANCEVGVIVARFQVHQLHDAHRELIETVISNHPKVIIFLGLSSLPGTQNNPLDFEARKKMLLYEYPNITVLYIKDMPNDHDWSAYLDSQIGNVIGPTQTPMLYGGRESFISRYYGQYQTTELASSKYISGTEMRKSISSSVKGTEDFRAGVIWAVYNRYPQSVPTVDIVIRDKEERFLLVRKHNETKFRFVGGFSQPDDDSYEISAKRELHEEVNVETGALRYLGSCNVNDWRFAHEVDKIKTIVFETEYLWGTPIPKDKAEIAEARWFDKWEVYHNLVDEHKGLFEKFYHTLTIVGKDN